MIDAIRERLERAKADYPILAKLLDGSFQMGDVAALERACHAAGLTDVANGLRVLREDPNAFRTLAAQALTQSDVGRDMLAELAELQPVAAEGFDLLRRADAFLNALKR